jgi:molecular chaperone GrpE
MVKDHPKRKIEITDKRYRPTDDAPVQAPDAALHEFTQQPTADATSPAAQDVQSATPLPDWQAQAREYLDLAQRKEADLRNFRKRVQQDLEDARRFAVEGLLIDLFPALDGLAQAAHTYRDKPEGEDALLDGVRRTVKALETALGKHGVEKINTAPAPFDPHRHQALSVENSAEASEDTVAEVYVEGYRMGDVVLKPAMVRLVRPE